MKMLIKRIEEDQTGRLLVIPETADNYGFQFIYRAGKGLRWEPATSAFVAYEPSRWAHDELLRHIVSTAKSELGVELFISAETEWTNLSLAVAEDLRLALT